MDGPDLSGKSVNTKTLLELGRVSNLPTVWSNVLTGCVVGASLDAADTAQWVPPFLAAAVSGTLLYVGGMWLNDAFDADIDAIERPTRPIPSRRISRSFVFVVGFGLLAVALMTALIAAWLEVVSDFGLALGALGTALAVVAYDRFHKGFSWSPVLMGACRFGLYLMGALATTGQARGGVLWLALALMGYVVGLTHVARFENGTNLARLWVLLALLAPTLVTLALGAGSVPQLTLLALHVGWTVSSLLLLRQKAKGIIGRVVVRLIAGISLVDAVFLAAVGTLIPACLAVLAFVATLGLQRWVKGT